ncbi:HDOD domain-containing protein [Halothiobacillus sp. DCM-1]|uniref:HDOD domain-containing protein n=1 Tax=Halothiobacillus sp. DCM-1 TaxID=3112558 RepID=UPI00324B2278
MGIFSWLFGQKSAPSNPAPAPARRPRPTTELKSESAYPDRELIARLFYLHLFGARAYPLDPGSTLRPAEADWLAARQEDLKRTPTQLTQLVPRLPAVLPRLMTALNDTDTPIRHLTELIESDPIIAAQVLRLINSPAMRVRREDITSLEQAVLLLGFAGMREVVSAAMFSPIGKLNLVAGVHPLLIHDIWPISLRAANALRMGLKSKAAPADAPEGGEAFDLYLSVLIEHTGLIALVRQQPLTGSALTPAYLDAVRRLVPAYSARIAEAWALSPRAIDLIRNPDPVLDGYRQNARYFATACALNRRGFLDPAQLLHLCRDLPPYASEWHDTCVSHPQDTK